MKNFFRNSKGQVVIWQAPNAPLWAWIGLTIFGWTVRHSSLHKGVHELAQVALASWAYLEIRSGESTFRRVLGMIVLLGIILPYFF